ncbi:MFS transporter [Catelliglobosispora koreensis]|uniref:MFS transporter n=1 Tax=Catelliglobosispora koreensis TaxID=129052 RepID=UPI00036DA674|nr:MFS transporter [Catelliglobosispora koreensis]
MRLGLLADHDYRALFASTTVSQFGQQVSMLALPLAAVLAVRATEFQVGLLFMLMSLAFLLIGLPAGAWVDRLRRRNVLIVADLVRAMLLLSIPVAWWTGVLTIWQLYAVALLLGVFTVFFDVAYQSYLPHLAGRDKLVEGNSKLESMRAVSQIAGPGLGGQLVQILTAPVALLVDAIGMVVSALFVTRIRKREPKPDRAPDAHLLREIREGLRFVVKHPLLRRIAMCTGTFNLFGTMAQSMLLVFLARDLDIREGLIGLVFTIGGIGGLAGALVARRIATWVGQGPAIWLSVALTTPFALLLPLAEPGWKLWLAAAGQAVVGFGVVVYNVNQLSFRQGLTPDHLLGRMNATMRFLVWGTMPIGGLLGGIAGELAGARTTIWIGSIAGCLAFLPVFLSPLRTLRTLPSEADATARSLA